MDKDEDKVEELLELEEEQVEDEEEILMDECPLAINFLTEFLGMAIQMYTGCLGSVYTFGKGPFITSFSFGLGRLACYEIFNHISPLHINPAKSLGFLVLGRMHVVRFVVYLVAQFTGSIAGCAYVMAVIPPGIEGVCLTHLHRGVTPVQALLMEFFVTMILMLAVASITDPFVTTERDSLPLKMGFIVFVLIICVEPFTAAGKNPARSFGPSILYKDITDHWLYEVGPFCGAIFGALLYRFVFNLHQKHSLHRWLVSGHLSKCFHFKRRSRT